jgi:hypothetical protein
MPRKYVYNSPGVKSVHIAQYGASWATKYAMSGYNSAGRRFMSRPG